LYKNMKKKQFKKPRHLKSIIMQVEIFCLKKKKNKSKENCLWKKKKKTPKVI